MARVATCVPGAPLDAALRIGADLTVVGPEVPLVEGVVDQFQAKGLRIVGPRADAAQLEGSKIFAKNFFKTSGIPTATYEVVERPEQAHAILHRFGLPVVLKADGLAAGKGVTIAETRQAAVAAVEACFSGALGDGGVVIEEFLEGEEASFFALVDGGHALALASAQDHKRAFDGDRGPNTGGMGAYSPAPVVTPEIARRAMDEIIWPTVKGMAARGMPYKGVLYAGLMITDSGPKLIEYNVRFGDPEAQVLMLRLKSDLLSALLATADGVLNAFDVRWYDDASIVVVMAANGYPDNYAKGGEIRGLDAAREVEGVEVFHAGTARDGGRLVAAGGRVLNVAASGRTIAEARERAYAAVARIDWPGGFYRSDIGWRALQREKPKP